MTTTIAVPHQIDLDTSIQFAKNLKKVSPSDHCVIDFGQVNKVRPFGMLRTACAIREFIGQYSEGTLFEIRHRPNNSYNKRAINYAAHMGFFQACGLEFGKTPGEGAGKTHVPIAILKTSELLEGYGHHGPQVEKLAALLTRQLLRKHANDHLEPVAISFDEIVRNVIDHSRSDFIGYCAQYWPSTDLVEIAIADFGIGLRQTLELNPRLNINSDRDALKNAILPGISGKVSNNARSDPYDRWANSGYGLYLIYRLCNEAGNFYMCSGQTGMYLTKDPSKNIYFDTNFNGTILRLRLYPQKLDDFQTLWDRFVLEGELHASESNNGAVLSASKISALIRENFRRIQDDINVGSRVEHLHFGVGRVEDIVRSESEELAIVSFMRGESELVPLYSLILYDGPLDANPNFDDIPL